MSKLKIGVALALLIAVAPCSLSGQAPAISQSKASSVTGQNDNQILADITKQLGNSRFSGVKVSVENGVITLSGTVDVYQQKEDADRKAHRVKNIVAVRNQIE